MIPKDEGSIFGDEGQVLLTNTGEYILFLTGFLPKCPGNKTAVRGSAVYSSVKVIQDFVGLSRPAECNAGRILQTTFGHRTLFSGLDIPTGFKTAVVYHAADATWPQ